MERIFPHNLPKDAVIVKEVRGLIGAARELGGIVYDVAVDSGLLSAEQFMLMQFDEEVPQEPVFAENMTVVVEVYVEFADGREPDRIFLYSDNAEWDVELLKEGIIRNRKLLIPYEKLATLHEWGYKCILGNAPGGRNAQMAARYSDCFGKDRRMENYQMWNWFTYVGNGFNRGLMLRTTFESILVMPDLHAVQEAVRAYYAEQQIRETLDEGFDIEQIMMQDKQVLMAMQDGNEDILGCADREFYEDLPDSYKNLIYQIVYIKTYYPKVYNRVWNALFESDEEE